MKKFFTKSIFFILPIALIFTLFEYQLSKIPNSYNFKQKKFLEKSPNLELLVLGSSHSYYGINPDEIVKDLGFNFANSSQNLYYDLELTKKYLKQMPNLKNVIISISYFSLLGDILFGSSEDFRKHFYFRYFGILPNHLDAGFKNLSLYFLYGQEKCWEFFTKGFEVNLAENIHNNGWFQREKENNLSHINESAGIERIKFHHSTFSEEYFGNNQNYLRELITLLSQKGINVVLVSPPVHQFYYQNMDPKKEEIYLNFINQFCSEFGIKFFNYLKDNRFNIDDFANVDHLNKSGAKKFSKIIKSEVFSTNQK